MKNHLLTHTTGTFTFAASTSQSKLEALDKTLDSSMPIVDDFVHQQEFATGVLKTMTETKKGQADMQKWLKTAAVRGSDHFAMPPLSIDVPRLALASSSWLERSDARGVQAGSRRVGTHAGNVPFRTLHQLSGWWFLSSVPGESAQHGARSTIRPGCNLIFSADFHC